MASRITVTDLNRELQSILERVRQGGDSFVIEQDGEAVATLGPPSETATWATLAAAVRGAGMTDPEFAADLDEIQTSMGHSPPSARFHAPERP